MRNIRQFFSSRRFISQVLTLFSLFFYSIFVFCGIYMISLSYTQTDTQSISDSLSSTESVTEIPPSSSGDTPSAPLPENSRLEVHFIDVGQADSTLVLCDGEAMLIDGGTPADSSLLYTYLKNLNVDHLNYVIGTHAHEDHIGGLAGALNYATADTVYCPVKSYDTDTFNNFTKTLDKKGLSITIPNSGDTFRLGNAKCTILAVNTQTAEPNNTSIVLRMEHGDVSFLFTADAERIVEDTILESGTDIQSTVLKVGHHGSDTSTGYLWLREIMPQYGVISVGKDNGYGHPTQAVLSRLRDADVTTYRTDLQGDIICTSDGSRVSFTVERNPNADVYGNIGENSTTKKPPSSSVSDDSPPVPDSHEPTKADYIANKNTKKFHYPSCSSANEIKASNRWDYVGTREELIDMGYAACKRCNP